MLKQLYENDPAMRDSYVYQRVLLTACANNKESVSFDVITKSGLRPTIIHGKYIIKNKKFRTLYTEWCNIVLNS